MYSTNFKQRIVCTALLEPSSWQQKDCKLTRNSIGYSEVLCGAQKSFSSSTEESVFQLEPEMLDSTEE